MASTPSFALGRHVSVTLTPLIKDEAGAFTNATLGTVSFNGRVESHNLGLSLTTENIAPIHSFNSNPIPIEQSAEYQLTEVGYAMPDVTSSQKGIANGNVLKSIAKLSFYVRLGLTLSNDAGEAIESIYAVCLMTSPFAMNVTKNRVEWSSTLQTIAVYNAATGAALPNPQFVTGTGSPTI